MTRIELPTEDDLPEEYRGLLEGMTTLETGALNVLRAKATNPALLEASREYVSVLREEYGLGPRETELVILAVAETLGSEYEWQQHVPRALDAGVASAEINAIGRRESGPFDQRDRTLIRYARAVAERRVDDDRFEAMAAYFDESVITGVTLLAARYVETAHFADALDLSLEDEFVGWVPYP